MLRMMARKIEHRAGLVVLVLFHVFLSSLVVILCGGVKLSMYWRSFVSQWLESCYS